MRMKLLRRREPDLAFPDWDGSGWTVYLRWPCGCEWSDSGPDAATFDPQIIPVACPEHTRNEEPTETPA